MGLPESDFVRFWLFYFAVLIDAKLQGTFPIKDFFDVNLNEAFGSYVSQIV